MRNVFFVISILLIFSANFVSAADKAKAKVPSNEEIWQVAVSALAQGEMPDYSTTDSKAVVRAYKAAFKDLKKWLPKFKAQIAKKSEGKWILKDANQDEFDVLVRGEAAYLKLCGPDKKEILIILGPYDQPFFIDQGVVKKE